MKTNPSLGKQVHTYLVEKGVESPFHFLSPASRVQKVVDIKTSYETILDVMRADMKDDSLKATPMRVAEMYVDELFSGLSYENFPHIGQFENKYHYDEMVVQDGITVKSVCEHHFMPIYGTCRIGYIPNGKVIGLSKLNRIVDFFARRPQVQERLTEQVYHCLVYLLGTDNIGVIIKADHFCVKFRGVEHENSRMTTSHLGGVFREHEVRLEFIKI